MKRRRIYALMLVAFFLLTTSVMAENIYVSQTAQGSDTGADCSDAHSMAWLNTAGNWGAGADKVSAGDTVHLCGTLTSTLTIQASGSSGSPITILFESGAKFSKTAWGSTSSSAIYASNKSYIIINGGTNGAIENTDNGTNLGTKQESTFIYCDSCTHWIIENLTLANMYVRAEGSENNAYGKAIWFTPSASDVTIDNCNIHDGQKVVLIMYSSGDSNVTVSNNTISNFAVGVTIGSAGGNATIDNVKIFGNDLHRTLLWSGQANIHTDLTHCYAAHTGSSITNLKIYNNKYYGGCGTNASAQAYVEANVGTIINPLIYNNLFMFDAGEGTCGDGSLYIKGYTSGAEVYNNTFVSDGTASQYGIITSGNGTKIKNNIFVDNPVSISQPNSTSDISDSDYNSFTPTTKFNNGNWTQISLSSWKSATGFETHSITADPGLDSNYKPSSSGSAVVGAATNLTSLGITTLNSDKAGVERPSSGAWDIGAYEYYPGTVSGIALQGITIQ